MAPMVVVSFVALLLASPPISATAAHPIAGVISLLENLEVETKQEAAVEEETYQKFTYWCKRSTRRLTRHIKKEKTRIDELKDKIAGLDADIETTNEDIKALQAQLEMLDQQAKRARAMRDDHHSIYEGIIDNLDKTIHEGDRMVKFVREEYPMNRLTLMIKTLLETFEKLAYQWNEKKAMENDEEANEWNAYKLAKQARDNSIEAARSAEAAKTRIRSERETQKAQAESDKAEEENMLEGDTASLEKTDSECKTKKAEWDERSKVRSQELEAMAMAKKILSEVTGVRNPDTHEIPTKSLMVSTARVERDISNVEAGLSFLQVVDPKVKAVNLLRKTATALHDKSLEKLAQQISTYDGPFDKIKAMMEKMIFRLMGEQKNEDEHKLWCDMETEKSTESKDDKTEKVNLLNLKVAEMDASIKLLAKQIVENNGKVNTITEYQLEETKLRDENHAEILATIKDSQNAKAAILDAISVLKEFYKKSGMIAKEQWEFIQTRSRRDVELPDSPSTWDSSYTGTTDPKSGSEGVLTLLDETLQKFDGMEAEAKVTDETDQKAYEQDMAAKKVEIDDTNTDTRRKTTKKESLQESMENAAALLKHTSSELDAVEQYLKDLEPACSTGDSSYDDRKKARADEIEALRKAQTILEEAFRAKFLQK